MTLDPETLYDAALQRDFPLVERPYRAEAERLGCSEWALLEQLERDRLDHRISRIGAVFAPNTIGVSTLAALAVPPEQLNRVALVTFKPYVSHSYVREGHAYNLWLVLGARNREQLADMLDHIAQSTGLTPLDLPMEREYHIDLGFSLVPNAPAAPRAPPARIAPPALDASDWQLIAALEEGLRVTPRPYDLLASRAMLPLPIVLARLQAWRQSGVMRRLGVVLRHRELGYRRNLMCVWDWPDDQVDAFGARLAQLPCVNLCYRRTRRGADWPYNLFVMLHPRDEEQAEQGLRQLAQAGAAPHLVLASQYCWKQEGTRYAALVPPRYSPANSPSFAKGRDTGIVIPRPAFLGPRWRPEEDDISLDMPLSIPQFMLRPPRKFLVDDAQSPDETATLDALARRIINTLQRGFPLSPYPYARAAQALGTDEGTLIERLRDLRERGLLTRFGPLFQIERAGGRFVLCACHAPEQRLDAVIAAINARSEVAHNYERTHYLNLWFVLALASPDALAATLARIEADTGVPVLAFPKEREYLVNLYLPVPEKQPGPPVVFDDAPPPDALAGEPDPAFDRALIRATQNGLPLVPAPYRLLADQLGCTERDIIACLHSMRARGLLRRIGAVPQHYRLGWRANAMMVWDVDDAQVDALGERISALPGVSHCYRRPRHLPEWPYNLFAMVHGRTYEDAVPLLAQVTQAVQEVGTACRGGDVLWSMRVLKKMGVRI